MTLGRTSSGAIKIKTDSPGLRAVECTCCGGGGCSISQAQIDWLRTVTAYKASAPFVGPNMSVISLTTRQPNIASPGADDFEKFTPDGSGIYSGITGTSSCEYDCQAYPDGGYYCPDGSDNPTYSEDLDDYVFEAAFLGFTVVGNELTGGFAENISTVVCEGGQVVFDESFNGCGVELYNRLKTLLISSYPAP